MRTFGQDRHIQLSTMVFIVVMATLLGFSLIRGYYLITVLIATVLIILAGNHYLRKPVGNNSDARAMLQDDLYLWVQKPITSLINRLSTEDDQAKALAYVEDTLSQIRIFLVENNYTHLIQRTDIILDSLKDNPEISITDMILYLELLRGEASVKHHQLGIANYSS